MQNRHNVITNRLKELYEIRKEWIDVLVAPTDPNNKYRAEKEVARLDKLITEYEFELEGGPKVIETGDHTFTRPRSNKWKLTAIALLSLLAGLFAFYYFFQLRTPYPDYSRYADDVNKGDSLMKINKVNEARKYYESAIRYNPGDPAVEKKLSLLKQADSLYNLRKDTEARNTLQLVINIPISPTLSPTALANAGVKNNPPLLVSISISGVNILIQVSGGVPYDNNKKPYQLAGLSCSDCIIWTKDSIGYTAQVGQSFIKTGSIRLKDRLGQFSDAPVPQNDFTSLPPVSTNPDAASPLVPKPALKNNQSPEEAFKEYAVKGDSLSDLALYDQAIQSYRSALSFKPTEATVLNKIKDCEHKRDLAKEKEARNIPRTSISGGTFLMGTNNGSPEDGPAHNVAIGSFTISKTEVTVAQYKNFCQFTGRALPPEPSFGWNNDYPITNVSWKDAADYCNWVGGRLPTEAEWEYAALANSAYPYSGGSQINTVAIYRGNSGTKPNKVRSKAPNAFGLYDMTGNASEWCADYYGKNYYKSSPGNNPGGPATGSSRVVRGGSYSSSLKTTSDNDQLQITYRNFESPDARKPYLGFRVVFN